MKTNKVKNKSVSKKKHSIKDPIVYNVCIDTDDDFTIDGETFFNKNITVSKEENSADNLIKYLNSLHYESHSSKQNKIDDFKKMISSIDFKMVLRTLTYEESNFDHSKKVTFNQNISLVITLASNTII